jgi:hypothetical protein
MKTEQQLRCEERRLILEHLAEQTGFGCRRLRRLSRTKFGKELVDLNAAQLAELSIFVKESTAARQRRLSR